MPDVRVYRAAFAPAVVALFIAAFSLADRPAAVTTPFAPAGFTGTRAFDTLQELGEAFPERPAGSDADRALADRVAETFRAERPARQPQHARPGARSTARPSSRRSSGCGPGCRAGGSS